MRLCLKKYNYGSLDGEPRIVNGVDEFVVINMVGVVRKEHYFEYKEVDLEEPGAQVFFVLGIKTSGIVHDYGHFLFNGDDFVVVPHNEYRTLYLPHTDDTKEDMLLMARKALEHLNT